MRARLYGLFFNIKNTTPGSLWYCSHLVIQWLGTVVPTFKNFPKINPCMYICMHACMYVHTYVCMCSYVATYVHIHAYVCIIHTYIRMLRGMYYMCIVFSYVLCFRIAPLLKSSSRCVLILLLSKQLIIVKWTNQDHLHCTAQL